MTNSHDLRKSIAKVLTVINANQRAQLRLFYKNKKYLPIDLRPKQTRAIRRRLSKEDKARVLEKTAKRSMHFPQRKYAVKVCRTPHLIPWYTRDPIFGKMSVELTISRRRLEKLNWHGLRHG